jgi:5-methylcytosine-specific restriction enzyme subunit McrC
MRTITLWEHRPATWALSPAELGQVMATELVEVAPVRGETGTYRLTPRSTVGTAVLRDVRLLIRPKVSLENLFYLLGFGADLVKWAGSRFPFDTQPDLLAIVGWMFEAEVRRALAGGVVRGYRQEQEALTTLRGRVDVAAQIRSRQGLPLPLECRFDEFTPDVELNRIIKAAILRLLRTPRLDPPLTRALRFRLHSYTDVAAVDYRDREVPEVAFSRLNRHWEHAAGLARLILQCQVLRDREGAVLGEGFTIDMNRLFERFVSDVIAAACPPAVRAEPQAARRLAPRLPIKPDIVLRRGHRDVAVADVKYKLPSGGWVHDDAYQLLAYCTALGLPAGLLIYASPLPHDAQPVAHTGIRLERIGLDLDVDRHALRASVERVAQLLLAHARAEPSHAPHLATHP